MNVDVKGSGVLGSGVLVGSADDLGGNSIVGFLVDGYNLQMCVCCTQMESLMPYFFVFSFNTLEDCSRSECRCKGPPLVNNKFIPLGLATNKL